MAPHKRRIQVGIIALSVTAIALCPVTTAALLSTYPASAYQPFGTVQPVEETFTPPVGTEVATPSPMPTVVPCDCYEEDDPNKPKYEEIEKGDTEFGYGPVDGDPDSYLIWYTDENGTHYRLVSKDSEVLFGTVDPSTNQRRDNGFNELIRQREEVKKDLTDVNLEIAAEGKLSDGFFGGALLFVGGGLVVCILATAGICSIAAPILGTAGLGAVVFGMENAIDQTNLVEKRDATLADITDQESKLGEKFDNPDNSS